MASSKPFTVNSRGYKIEGETYSRVTSILGTLNKPMLIPWASKIVAEYAYQHRNAWVNLPEDKAIQLLKGRPDEKKDFAADRGTAVHNALDKYLKGKEPGSMKGDEPLVYASALAFLEKYKPEPLAVEMTVYSPTLKYAGTCDLPCIVEEKPTAWDWKTSSGVYPEYILQLAAYCLAERAFINDVDSENPLYGKDVKMGVVHVRSDGYTLYDIQASVHELASVWSSLVHVYNWRKKSTKQLVPREEKLAYE